MTDRPTPPPLPAGFGQDLAVPPDLAQPAGRPAPAPSAPSPPPRPTLTIRGIAYPLGVIAEHAWSKVFGHVARRKRKLILSDIADQYHNLPRDIWQEQWDQAKEAAEKVTEATITLDDVKGWLDCWDGLIFSFWLMLESSRREGLHSTVWTPETLADALSEDMDDRKRAELYAARDATTEQTTGVVPATSTTPPATTPPAPAPAPAPPILPDALGE